MREMVGVEEGEALRADSMYWYAGVIPVPPTIFNHTLVLVTE